LYFSTSPSGLRFGTDAVPRIPILLEAFHRSLASFAPFIGSNRASSLKRTLAVSSDPSVDVAKAVADGNRRAARSSVLRSVVHRHARADAGGCAGVDAGTAWYSTVCGVNDDAAGTPAPSSAVATAPVVFTA